MADKKSIMFLIVIYKSRGKIDTYKNSIDKDEIAF